MTSGRRVPTPAGRFRPMSETFTLSVPGAGLTVDPAAGGRIASLAVAGRELLLTDGPGPIYWGCYPMAPFAGRVRQGRFTWQGREHVLDLTMPPHAIHGTVFLQRWERESDTELVTPLLPPWPWPGEVRQIFDLTPERLAMTLEVHAGEPMPASCGWHPWFRRRLGPGGPARVMVDPAFMLRRDPDGVASREEVPPPAGPWDDCFGGLGSAPVVDWPGVLRLEIASTCDWIVVYDERDDAVCVEPQTAPPDDLNHAPVIVEPGRPLVATTTWTWYPSDGD